ncbi:TfoX/Sxy family protein [Streptomyces canus]|uniref:TfoX/Sxy family protein n=1 Tax=Streptomyces canus TaxID=58343 RepID=UPI002E2B8A5B|nr:TfoX/Sxy family protein [Streptomyces canus]
MHRPSASSQPPHMFGGIASLYLGNTAVGVTGDELMVRVGPDAADADLARPGARVFDMTGRPMRGWVVVAGSAVTEDEALGAWNRRGTRLRSEPAAHVLQPPAAAVLNGPVELRRGLGARWVRGPAGTRSRLTSPDHDPCPTGWPSGQPVQVSM